MHPFLHGNPVHERRFPVHRANFLAGAYIPDGDAVVQIRDSWSSQMRGPTEKAYRVGEPEIRAFGVCFEGVGAIGKARRLKGLKKYAHGGHACKKRK